MFIKQLSIFVENKHGRLESIIDALGKNGVNLKALSIADTTDFGILRIIADNTDKAKELLNEIGVVSKSTDVLAVFIDHCTGGLAKVLKVVTENEIGIEYMYAFLGRTEGKALMVLKTDDDNKTQDVLKANGIELAKEEDI